MFGWSPRGQTPDPTLDRYDVSQGRWLGQGEAADKNSVQFHAPQGTAGKARGWGYMFSPGAGQGSPTGVPAPKDLINFTPKTGEISPPGVQAPVHLDNMSMVPHGWGEKAGATGMGQEDRVGVGQAVNAAPTPVRDVFANDDPAPKSTPTAAATPDPNDPNDPLNKLSSTLGGQRGTPSAATPSPTPAAGGSGGVNSLFDLKTDPADKILDKPVMGKPFRIQHDAGDGSPPTVYVVTASPEFLNAWNAAPDGQRYKLAEAFQVGTAAAGPHAGAGKVSFSTDNNGRPYNFQVTMPDGSVKQMKPQEGMTAVTTGKMPDWYPSSGGTKTDKPDKTDGGQTYTQQPGKSNSPMGSAIDSASDDPRVRLAMRVGALLEGGNLSGGWNAGDGGGSTGPFQINHNAGMHKDISVEDTKDPEKATRYMLNEYQNGVNKVPPELWNTNPQQAAALAAYYAERPAQMYPDDRIANAYKGALDDIGGKFDPRQDVPSGGGGGGGSNSGGGGGSSDMPYFGPAKTYTHFTDESGQSWILDNTTGQATKFGAPYLKPQVVNGSLVDDKGKVIYEGNNASVSGRDIINQKGNDVSVTPNAVGDTRAAGRSIVHADPGSTEYHSVWDDPSPFMLGENLVVPTGTTVNMAKLPANLRDVQPGMGEDDEDEVPDWYKERIRKDPLPNSDLLDPVHPDRIWATDTSGRLIPGPSDQQPEPGGGSFNTRPPQDPWGQVDDVKFGNREYDIDRYEHGDGPEPWGLYRKGLIHSGEFEPGWGMKPHSNNSEVAPAPTRDIGIPDQGPQGGNTRITPTGLGWGGGLISTPDPGVQGGRAILDQFGGGSGNTQQASASPEPPGPLGDARTELKHIQNLYDLQMMNGDPHPGMDRMKLMGQYRQRMGQLQDLINYLEGQQSSGQGQPPNSGGVSAARPVPPPGPGLMDRAKRANQDYLAMLGARGAGNLNPDQISNTLDQRATYGLGPRVPYGQVGNDVRAGQGQDDTGDDGAAADDANASDGDGAMGSLGWASPIPPEAVKGTGNKFGQQASLGPHMGTDIQAISGTPVMAPTAGTVVSVHTQPVLGLTVVIRDPQGHEQKFGHLLSASVSVGDKVKQGQQIANVGESGSGATGPHLHLGEKDAQGRPVNPEPKLGWISKMPMSKDTVGGGQDEVGVGSSDLPPLPGYGLYGPGNATGIPSGGGQTTYSPQATGNASSAYNIPITPAQAAYIQQAAQNEQDLHQVNMMNAQTQQDQERENARHNAAMEQLQRDANVLNLAENGTFQQKAAQDQLMQGTFAQNQFQKQLQTALSNPWLQSLTGMRPGWGLKGGANNALYSQMFATPSDQPGVQDANNAAKAIAGSLQNGTGTGSAASVVGGANSAAGVGQDDPGRRRVGWGADDNMSLFDPPAGTDTSQLGNLNLWGNGQAAQQLGTPMSNGQISFDQLESYLGIPYNSTPRNQLGMQQLAQKFLAMTGQQLIPDSGGNVFRLAPTSNGSDESGQRFFDALNPNWQAPTSQTRGASTADLRVWAQQQGMPNAQFADPGQLAAYYLTATGHPLLPGAQNSQGLTQNAMALQGLTPTQFLNESPFDRAARLTELMAPTAQNPQGMTQAAALTLMGKTLGQQGLTKAPNVTQMDYAGSDNLKKIGWGQIADVTGEGAQSWQDEQQKSWAPAQAASVGGLT